MNNQPQYGKEVPLPSTYVRCGNCDAHFALMPDDLGKAKGRRVTCGTCDHSWFQSKEKLFTLRPGFELAELQQTALDRIRNNLAAGRKPSFLGVAKLYVGNLDYKCTEKDLVDIFTKMGDVGDCTIVKSPEGRSRGFAFVTMISEEGGAKGLHLDGEELLGRPMQVRPPNSQ